MADREEIAAILAASLLKPIEYASAGAAQPLETVQGRAAYHAVAVYRAVLAELANEGGG